MKAEIRKLLGTEKLIIGTERALKAVRRGDVAKVILASNAPVTLTAQLERYRKINAFEMVDAGVTNDELGILCKKPFSIAILAVRP